MDLLTVLMHEVGHLLGHGHGEGGVMAETLTAGGAELPRRGPRRPTGSLPLRGARGRRFAEPSDQPAEGVVNEGLAGRATGPTATVVPRPLTNEGRMRSGEGECTWVGRGLVTGNRRGPVARTCDAPGVSESGYYPRPPAPAHRPSVGGRNCWRRSRWSTPRPRLGPSGRWDRRGPPADHARGDRLPSGVTARSVRSPSSLGVPCPACRGLGGGGPGVPRVVRPEPPRPPRGSRPADVASRGARPGRPTAPGRTPRAQPNLSGRVAGHRAGMRPGDSTPGDPIATGCRGAAAGAAHRLVNRPHPGPTESPEGAGGKAQGPWIAGSAREVREGGGQFAAGRRAPDAGLDDVVAHGAGGRGGSDPATGGGRGSRLRRSGQVEQVAGLEARLGGPEHRDHPGEVRRRVRRPGRHLAVA